MSIIKALHIASFNGNIGDNANHNGFRKRLKEELNREVLFTELEIREFYQSWNLKDFNSKEFINLCNDHDVVIIGGGNFFELKWDYSHTGTTINMSSDTLDKIKTPIIFHGVGCDIAKGASKRSIKKFKSFLEQLTNNPNVLVSVRNDGSFETIEKLYGNVFSDKIYEVPDGAFFMKSKTFNFPEISNTYKSIGINVVSDMKDIRFDDEQINGITYEVFIHKFGELLNNLMKNNNYQIILFPHIYSDLKAVYDLLEHIDDKYRRTRTIVAPYLTGEGSDEYIFGLYSKCELVMGMRFHSNVCSVSQNIPSIALSSYKKIEDLYNKLGISNRLVEVNKKGFETKLYKLVEESLNNKLNVSSNYVAINRDVFIQSKPFYEALEKWFNSYKY